MKRPYQIKNRSKAALLLAAVIVLITLNNLWERKRYSSLEHSMASIYQDRLLPSTYLYEISSHLYQKKILLENSAGAADQWSKGIGEHDRAIDGLVKNYELTYLTDTEKKQWALFKAHLKTYNREEKKNLSSSHDASYIPVANQYLLDNSFTAGIASLNHLSQIQAGEGKNLQHRSKGIIDGSLLASHFEMALLIVMGAIAVALIGIADRNFLQASQN